MKVTYKPETSLSTIHLLMQMLLNHYLWMAAEVDSNCMKFQKHETTVPMTLLGYTYRLWLSKNFCCVHLLIQGGNYPKLKLFEKPRRFKSGAVEATTTPPMVAHSSGTWTTILWPFSGVSGYFSPGSPDGGGSGSPFPEMVPCPTKSILHLYLGQDRRLWATCLWTIRGGW